MFSNELEVIWHNIIIEAKLLIHSEPILHNYIHKTILQHKNFKHALLHMIINQLSNTDMYIHDLNIMLTNIYRDDNIVISAARDICAIRSHDPSVDKYSTPFLYLKGFHALQIYRVFHWLWHHNYQALAMYFYNYMSITFNIDIHPAATIGCGIMLDHATGLVIGETSVIENNVSIMQSVTLGSTGKVSGNRHPKIKQGVMIGAGAIVLGNIEIGTGAKIGAGSIVLHSVPPYSTVAGNPAKLITNK